MTAPQSSSARRLKILFSLLYYYPHPTGLTYHAQLVAEALARRGHEVTVLASRHSRDLPRQPIIHNGVRVIRLWAPIRLSRGMIMPAYPWQLFRLAREHDIVSIHTPMLETALVSLMASAAGVKVVPTHHGDLFLPDGLLNNFIVKIMYLMYAFMAKRAPRIIGYSEDYRENSYYLRPFRDKVEAIYPPIAIPEPNAEDTDKLRRQWRNGSGPIIGFAGRFVHEKRPDLLIKALDIINRKYPGAKVVFAGEDHVNYESTWRKHRALVESYKSQLIFLGLIRDRQQLANYYAACDILVMPSNNECFGLTQVEAMLCGTPVVMTNIYGGRVPVLVTGMGKLAKSGDWHSIGKTAVELLDNREDFIKSRDYVRQCFSFEQTVDQYEAIFRQFAR